MNHTEQNQKVWSQNRETNLTVYFVNVWFLEFEIDCKLIHRCYTLTISFIGHYKKKKHIKKTHIHLLIPSKMLDLNLNIQHWELELNMPRG